LQASLHPREATLRDKDNLSLYLYISPPARKHLSASMGISVLLPGSKRRARRAARSAPAATLAVDSSPGKGAVVEVSVTAAKEAPKLRPAIDVVAGGLARAMSQTTIHPLDTLKVRPPSLLPTCPLLLAGHKGGSRSSLLRQCRPVGGRQWPRCIP